MFQADHFGAQHFSADHFYSGDDIDVTLVARRLGAPVVATSFDYWLKDALDAAVASGTVTTDGAGQFTLTIPAVYSGQRLQLFLNNLEFDLVTTGKLYSMRVIEVP